MTEPDAAAHEFQLHEWNEEFDVDDGTIDRIEERIYCEMNHHDDNEDHLAVLQGNATFLQNNKDRMRYVSLRKVSLPVGSGVTEGACRSVIGERASRPSPRSRSLALPAVIDGEQNHASRVLDLILLPMVFADLTPHVKAPPATFYMVEVQASSAHHCHNP